MIRGNIVVIEENKMNIKSVEIPNESILKKDSKNYDYVDSYQIDFTSEKGIISSTEIGKAFFTSGPEWIGVLFKIRNKIVSVIGLKVSSGNTNDIRNQIENFKWEPGERLGLFKVFDKTNEELVLGEDDKHLNFRVSLFIEQSLNEKNKRLTVTTTVEFKNWFGRFYFLPVKPFHKLIVPTLLKGIVKELGK